MKPNKILINYEYYKIPEKVKELKRLEPFFYRPTGKCSIILKRLEN